MRLNHIEYDDGSMVRASFLSHGRTNAGGIEPLANITTQQRSAKYSTVFGNEEIAVFVNVENQFTHRLNASLKSLASMGSENTRHSRTPFS